MREFLHSWARFWAFGCFACGTSAGPDEGTAPASSAPGAGSGDLTSTVTNEDGSTVMTTADGTVIVTAADGTTTVMPAGTTTSSVPTDGSTPSEGPAPSSPSTAPTSTDPVDTPPMEPPVADRSVWINEAGRVDAARNEFEIQGDWYAFGDGVTSTQSGNPYVDDRYCVTGEADGMSGSWGVGIGLDLNGMGGEKMPYSYEGKLTGFQITLSGTLPAPARVHFIANPDVEVNPFIPATLGEEVYPVADAQVPFEWEVENAGRRVDGGTLTSLQILAPGDAAAGPIELCVEDFAPVFDETSGPSAMEGTTYVNDDGFIAEGSNDYGVTGPVYVIGDGASTTQTGVPYREGKYCVAGTFSGAEADWGAGIAIDLAHPPGEPKGAFAPSAAAAGFRFALSGATPGGVRIQFIVDEPQSGNQPFLVGQLNSTATYPIAWAEVPSSWDVADAGREVAGSVYSVQLYLEGNVAGPFDVCIDDFAPLSEGELSWAADPAENGYQGFRTVDPNALTAEYEWWKARHFRDCGDGSACVPRENGDCISEGVGYGMLLAVAFDDQPAFDQLWAYFGKHRTPSGMMKWQTNACGTAISAGSATDGDLDAAMALVQASCLWGGSYGSDANTLVAAIAGAAVDRSCSGGPVLKPGDDFGGCNETDPSYITPGYYRVFEALSGDAVWGELLESGYALLAENQTRKGGAFSDWSNASGGISSGDHSDDFGPDASRVPWRLATDLAWNAESRAATLLDAFADHVTSLGGPSRAFTNNSNYRGGSALSVLHRDAATAEEWTQAWLLTAVDDEEYFPGTLRVVYQLLAANRFPNGCD